MDYCFPGFIFCHLERLTAVRKDHVFTRAQIFAILCSAKFRVSS